MTPNHFLVLAFNMITHDRPVIYLGLLVDVGCTGDLF